MGVPEAAKVAIWIKDMVGDLSLSQRITVIHCDSHHIIFLVRNQVHPL